jgi:hypothetical protein
MFVLQYFSKLPIDDRHIMKDHLEALNDLIVLEHEDVLVGHEHLEGIDAVLLLRHLSTNIKCSKLGTISVIINKISFDK